VFLRAARIDAAGHRIGAPISVPGSEDLIASDIVAEPFDGGHYVVWKHAAHEVRLQRLGADLALLSKARSVELTDSSDLAALRPGTTEVGIVYSDGGVNGAVPGDTMGMHLLTLATRDARILRNVGVTALDAKHARYGAATWNGDDLLRIYSEAKSLFFAWTPGAKPATRVLSSTAAGGFGLFRIDGGQKVVASWSDERDDDQRRCNPGSCVTEAYLAILDGDGKVHLPPTRVTTSAVPEPLVLHRDDWQQFCPTSRP
jgi:hypothetical protein